MPTERSLPATDSGKHYAPLHHRRRLHNNMEYSPAGAGGRWIPQQSEEEVMTQEGVIAQLAVKPTADDLRFACFSYLSTDGTEYVFHSRRQSDSGHRRRTF